MTTAKGPILEGRIINEEGAVSSKVDMCVLFPCMRLVEARLDADVGISCLQAETEISSFTKGWRIAFMDALSHLSFSSGYSKTADGVSHFKMTFLILFMSLKSIHFLVHGFRVWTVVSSLCLLLTILLTKNTVDTIQ